jgi:hypothetical protein
VYVSEEQIAELKHAYQVLGVPLSATSASVKQAYRKLVKRWHPDLYQTGTEEYGEANQMTKMINDYVAARPRVPDPGYPKVDSIFKFSWFEFWVRLIGGAIWGAMFGFRVGLYYYNNDHAFIACIIFSSIAWTLIVTFAGDRFWQEFFGRWWIWR